jgi:hypothetical protein
MLRPDLHLQLASQALADMQRASRHPEGAGRHGSGSTNSGSRRRGRGPLETGLHLHPARQVYVDESRRVAFLPAAGRRTCPYPSTGGKQHRPALAQSQTCPRPSSPSLGAMASCCLRGRLASVDRHHDMRAGVQLGWVWRRRNNCVACICVQSERA